MRNPVADSCSSQAPLDDAETESAQAGANLCPECGQPGKPIGTKTLKQIVQPRHLVLVNKPGFRFCRSADCAVVYFHPDGDRLRKPDVRVRVGLKETEDPVPICYCFGFTEAMVAEEIRDTGRCSVPARIAAEVKAGHCACEIRNPQGSCCLGAVHAAVKRATEVVVAGKSHRVKSAVG